MRPEARTCQPTPGAGPGWPAPQRPPQALCAGSATWLPAAPADAQMPQPAGRDSGETTLLSAQEKNRRHARHAAICTSSV